MTRCTRCTRDPRGVVYRVGGADLCLRCALRDRALLRSSARVALVVGTLLTAINQGQALLSQPVTPGLGLRIGLTYVVPFCVATYGALSNARRREQVS